MNREIRRLAIDLGGGCALLLWAAAAPAAPVPPSAEPAAAPPPSALPAASPVRVDVGAGTYFPLTIGAEATVELPYRILVQTSLGWMPTPYSNTIIDLLGTFGALNSFEEQLIKSALQNSFVFRLSAGWRPFSSLGFEVLGGYTLLTAGGSVNGADVIDAFLESKGSSDRFSAATNQSVPLAATLQSFHVTLDYRFVLWDRIVLRPSLTYLQCFASSTSVTATPARPAGQSALNKLNSDLEGYLNPYFTEYVKTPLVGLTASYRF